MQRAIPSALMVLGVFALVSCVDETVVYDDRGAYQRVADEAAGYLGYANPARNDKLTFCGQCHRGLQAEWEQTAHADAWAGLQESDHAQAFCEACHTVNSLGNVHPAESADSTTIGGHVATDAGRRYHDVQCESCHGPGLEHTLDPVESNIPLAPMTVGAELTYGCGECHDGTHHPFVAEWSSSPHGIMITSAATNPACQSCHTGEGAMAALGVDADYLEKDSLLATVTEYAPITCVVCHDPHSAADSGQVRFPMHGVEPEATLCGQCHNRQAQPDTDGRQDWLQPHSAEAAVLSGSAGWFPSSGTLAPGDLSGHHDTSAEQPLCGACHVVPYSVTDENEETFFSVGHGFRAIPCVDGDGLPSGETECELTTAARSFEGCAECHSDAATALSSLNTALDRVITLARTLDGYLDQLSGEIDPDDGRFTVAEGAIFNFRLATTRTSFRSNQTTAQQRQALAPTVTHNPAFIEALLEETITAVEAAYPAVAADPATTVARPIGN